MMIDIKDLLKAGVHFGHKSSKWSPKMRPFIWGTRNKVHLIDIAKTAFLLKRAGEYLKSVAAEGKSVLWVGTKKAAQKPVISVALKLKMPYVANRWIGGTLTNFGQVKKAITRFLHFKDVLAKPTSHYKKKELSMIQKEVDRLEKNIGGIIDLDFPPAAVILIDPKKEHSALREAKNTKIPIIAMVDTNTNPDDINFLIPANDDSPRSITLILEYLAQCIEDGKKIYIEEQKAKNVDKEELKKKAREAAKKVEVKKPAAKTSTSSSSKKAESKVKSSKGGEKLIPKKTKDETPKSKTTKTKEKSSAASSKKAAKSTK